MRKVRGESGKGRDERDNQATRRNTIPTEQLGLERRSKAVERVLESKKENP
jgi:hypothetical protein